MASSIDFIGKDCPYCGAQDSLDIDDARGEVACTECAMVLAMGLEENALTRFEKDATMMDVDRGGGKGDRGGEGNAADQALTLAQSNLLSRTEAAALAAGLVGPVNAGKRMQDKYLKIHLPPSTVRFIEDLVELSRRNHGATIARKAIELAKLFLGRRRELSIKTQGERETAAACVMIAAGLDHQPIPTAELHMLNHTLRHIEERRQEILKETQVSAEDIQRLRDNFVPDLTRHYIRLCRLPLNHYEKACLTLVHVLKSTSAQHRSLEGLSEAERVLAAVLLAQTEPSIQWDARPREDVGGTAPQPAVLYDSLAADAHLDGKRVRTVMKMALAVLPDIARAFTEAMSSTKTETISDGSAAVKSEPADEARGTKRARRE